MIVTLFRSRLHAGVGPEYDAFVASTSALAETMPGFIGHKLFVAEDGERITVVEFASMQAQRAWALRQEHTDARLAGRKHFYSGYKIQVCDVLRTSQFAAKAPALPEDA